MNRTKIDWCDYTWNPVVGCLRNCSYCYAKRMNRRFKWIPNWNEPQFFPERLELPFKIKKPSTIFVGSVSDVGYWKKEWIESVLNVCGGCPQHTFMFLTKDGFKYNRYEFPDNCMLGATVVGDGIGETIYRLDWLKDTVNKNRKFLSLEPLLGSFEGYDLSFADLVIVGAMTGAGAKPPKKEWIDSIKHKNIHYKENIKKYLDTPKGKGGKDE